VIVFIASYIRPDFAGGLFDNAINKMLIKLRGVMKGGLPYSEAQFKTAVKDTIDFLGLFYTAQKLMMLSMNGVPGVAKLISMLEEKYTDFGSANIASTKAKLAKYESFITNNVVVPKSIGSYLKWRFGTVFKLRNQRIAVPMLHNYVDQTTTEFKDVMVQLDAAYAKCTNHGLIYADLNNVYKTKISARLPFTFVHDFLEEMVRDNTSPIGTRRLTGLTRVYLPYEQVAEKLVAGALLSACVDASTKSPFEEVSAHASWRTDQDVTAEFDLHSSSTTASASYMTDKMNDLMLLLAAGYSNPEISIGMSGSATVVSPHKLTAGRYLSDAEVTEYHVNGVEALFDN